MAVRDAFLARPRVDEALIDAVSHRLTERDRVICERLYEHRVLTSIQVHELLFDSAYRARKRLLELHRLRVVERFRPYRQYGSHPHHYLLDEVGARVVAAERGVEPIELDWSRARALKLASSGQLRHQVEANGFFTRLAIALRAEPGWEPAEWWGQRRCGQAWGELVRPDGYCQINRGVRAIGLWLEWDRGTEPLDRIAGKLERYEELALALERELNVLIVAPGERREREIRRALRASADARALTTTADRHHRDPLARNWLGAETALRVALGEL
jgi:hypothetical protein